MKQLRIVQSEVKMLPLNQTTDESDKLTIQSLIFEPLMQFDEGRLSPCLAESWKISDDGKRWTVNVRPALFHDGTSCTAEDVIQSLIRMRDAKDSFGMSGAYARYLKDLDFLPLSQTRFEITSPTPNADLGDILCEINISKMSSDGKPIIGTGRYKVTDYSHDQFVHLEQFQSSSQDLFENIHFLQLEQPEERYQALLSGEADLATGLEHLKSKPEDDSLVWGQSATTLSVMYYLNGFEKPFSQVGARLAINLAVNSTRIIEEVWQGQAIPATTIVSPFHFGYPGLLKPHNYNPEEAKRLLDPYEIPDQIVLRTPLFMPDRAPEISQLVKDDLEKIGLKVEIDLHPDRPEYAREVGAKKMGHLAIFDSSPHSTFRVLQEKISSRVQGTWWQGVEDDQLADRIEKANATIDTRQRANAYEEILSYLHSNPPWLYLYHPITRYAHLKNIKGISISHTGLVQLPG